MQNKLKSVELVMEKAIFASRWLMAPVYIALIGALILLLYSFMQELYHFAMHIFRTGSQDIVLGLLSLIDLTLAGNLLLIVMFSGYENFVSKIETAGHEDEPEWKGSVDFSSLKLKLVASIVAISAIHLLKTFMDISKISAHQVQWMVIIHVVFVVSGVLLALMDRIAMHAKKPKSKLGIDKENHF